ncbi:hypothetical protein BD626DRAFT_484025 [Schizophyllum amplum]|uniref:Polyadenylate-binding protein n=1 Tax=Schizophyllum amplum TaxID=97359 RepID=A0A550CQ34_9AGAR|nr:hypothetical protein BD626DRAFT_484025 [Auriculariopsis ampla]
MSTPAVDTVPQPVPEQVAAAAPPPLGYAASQPTHGAGTGTSASLYVGELDPTVTESMLFEIFNMIGPVASIRVCRDAVTRRSLGYAYVNYLNAPDGERALEQLNYSSIKNRPCRIMWSQRDPALRKTGQGNIFIKNLDEQIDNKALHDTFAAFGNVLSCKVATDEHGNSKGYGFVHYETAEAAENAIKSVNGMLLNDKKVYVGPHVSRKERQSKIDELRAQFTNLYVKNLDPEIGDEEFESIFAALGQVQSSLLRKDDQGRSLGFGFVNFETHDEAQKAVDALHESDYKGRKLYVSRAQKKAEREAELRKQYENARQERMNKYQGVNLYIKNLEDDVDDEKLRAEFEPFGAITSCRVMRDERAKSKGFGFVCYSSPDEATKAVAEMNNKMIGSKPLYVSLAQRKDVRRQQLESQIAQRSQVRMQQMAVQGGYMGGPMYYPPPGPAYPPQGRGMMGYGQPAMMPPRPRYPPQTTGMPIPAPYGQAPPPPQGYAMPPAGRGAPRQNGAPTSPVAGRAQARPPAQGVPAPAPANYKLNPQTRNATPSPSMPAPQPTEPGQINMAVFSSVSPMEQKQMLGEVIYLKIASQQPELSGKITGMLLEMDNQELLTLLDSPEALTGKVNEALSVLQDFSKDE